MFVTKNCEEGTSRYFALYCVSPKRMISGSIVLSLVLALAPGILAQEIVPNDTPSVEKSLLGAVRSGQALASLENENVVKRASMGFQGMRGKKDFRQDNNENSFIDEEKRAPMGFQGMRGKKDFLATDLMDSRIVENGNTHLPLALQGISGKTFTNLANIIREIDNDVDRSEDDLETKETALNLINEYTKRSVARIQRLREKRQGYEDEWAMKRAPMGFQGMRGKRILSPMIDDFEKRTRMGFQGMRGKKSDYQDRSYRSKRSPMVITRINDKRSNRKAKNFSKFFEGVRGKRNAPDSDKDYSNNKLSTYDFPDVQ